MALTNEEREQLFEVLNSGETIEDRAQAIIDLRAELEEETTARTELQTDYEGVSTNYLNAQEQLRQALRSIPQVKQNEPNEQTPNTDPELRGFQKLL